MLRSSSILANEQGSVLVVAILILALLTIIGISAMTTSTIETQIAGNDRLHKMVFYAADGGTEAGIELVEQNIELAGFDSARLDGDGNDEFVVGDIAGLSLNLYLNVDPPNIIPSDTNRDAYLPKSSNGNVRPYTNLRIGGNSSLSTGSAIQMCAGYEGGGKGSGGGGAMIVYDIGSQHNGFQNSNAVILLQWMHVM